jgi:hypothetical protein
VSSTISIDLFVGGGLSCVWLNDCRLFRLRWNESTAAACIKPKDSPVRIITTINSATIIIASHLPPARLQMQIAQGTGMRETG